MAHTAVVECDVVLILSLAYALIYWLALDAFEIVNEFELASRRTRYFESVEQLDWSNDIVIEPRKFRLLPILIKVSSIYSPCSQMVKNLLSLRVYLFGYLLREHIYGSLLIVTKIAKFSKDKGHTKILSIIMDIFYGFCWKIKLVKFNVPKFYPNFTRI